VCTGFPAKSFENIFLKTSMSSVHDLAHLGRSWEFSNQNYIMIDCRGCRFYIILDRSLEFNNRNYIMMIVETVVSTSRLK